MNYYIKNLCSLAALFLWTATWAVAEKSHSELPPLPLTGTPRMLAPPIYAGDGAVVVFASEARKDYRGPILIFVNRTRANFQSGVNLKLGSKKCPLEIRIGDKNDGDTSVLTARLRDVNGNLSERIELPDPEAADLTLFRRAVIVAFLRAWMVDDGGTDATMQNLPGWLIDGMMRYVSGEHRQEDFDRVYQLWSNACLPTADELYAFESHAAYAEPAVAAVLAGWFLEKRGHTFKRLLKNSAHGAAWSADAAAQLLADDFHGGFDRMLDTRFYALGGRVIKPGVTSEGIVSRFRSELLLFPTDYGMMFSNTNFCYSFRKAVDSSDCREIRQAALDKALAIRVMAAGRDGSLLALAESYEVFLQTLASGAESSRLLSLLTRAQTMQRELEHRVAVENPHNSSADLK